jgi:hypothetical protein
MRIQKNSSYYRSKFQVQCKKISVADPDPGSDALLTLDPGWVKKLRPRSGMNIPDHISESLETIFWGKIRCCGSGSGIGCLFDPWFRDPGWVESQHPDPGSGMNNPDHIFKSLENIFLIFWGLNT